jgi:hypothetical protein
MFCPTVVDASAASVVRLALAICASVSLGETRRGKAALKGLHDLLVKHDARGLDSAYVEQLLLLVKAGLTEWKGSVPHYCTKHSN